MKSSKPKVVKVSHSAHTFYDNGKLLDEPITERQWYFKTLEKAANDPVFYTCNIIINFGGREYERSFELQCRGKNRTILNIEKEENRVTFLIDKTEWRGELLQQIKQQEKEFYLSESELLSACHDLLKGEYSWVHFKPHVEIAGSIVDGMAFVNHCRNYNSNTKIIGFEVKTNHDDYKRLYGQLSSYLSICDEVYLVIEDNDPPEDLPFYVGIIRVQDSVSKIIRHATSLKHSADVGDCWKGLLKSLCVNIGLKRETPLIEFFNAAEDIKRKLIWNQFVIGWHKNYVNEEYVPLTEDEKRLVKLYFQVNEKGESKDIKPLINVLTLDHYAVKKEEEI